MRGKKRYALFKQMPPDLPPEAKFLFQTSEGYVVKVSPSTAEKFRSKSLKISGSIRKLKFSKTPK